MHAADFQRLVGEQLARIHRVALAWCRDPIAREDLVQEILLQLWRSHGRYDAARPFAHWVQRLATNVAISFVRRDQRQRRGTIPAEVAELAATPGPEPTDDVLRLLRCVDRLPAHDRALVVAWLEGLDHAAIGDVLGITPGSVATRWWRLKERLQRELRGDVLDGDDGDDGEEHGGRQR
ncbi:MAG: RNA polymerase sigma factor [Planctomycetota bacterium]